MLNSISRAVADFLDEHICDRLRTSPEGMTIQEVVQILRDSVWEDFNRRIYPSGPDVLAALEARVGLLSSSEKVAENPK